MKLIQYTLMAYASRKFEDEYLNLKYQLLLILHFVTSNCKHYIPYNIRAYIKEYISWFEFTKEGQWYFNLNRIKQFALNILPKTKLGHIKEIVTRAKQTSRMTIGPITHK